MTDEHLEPLLPAEKLEISRRMQSQGAADAFAKRREDHRQAAKKCGVSREGAVTMGWRKAMAEFADLLKEPEAAPVQEEEPLSKETEERFKAAPLDVVADVKEAYEKMSRPRLTADDFDRSGGWEFYQFACNNAKDKATFLSDYVVKFLGKVKSDDNGPEGWSDRDLEIVSLLEEIAQEHPTTMKCPHCGGEVEL